VQPVNSRRTGNLPHEKAVQLNRAVRRLRWNPLPCLATASGVRRLPRSSLLKNPHLKKVPTGAGGFQAEQAAPTYRPDVVLLDIGLPEINGWELADSLRSVSATIVAVTAYQTLDDRRKSQQAGISFHLGKPVRREEILGLLAQIAAAN
jgi:CheY-like chemotaxis protein